MTKNKGSSRKTGRIVRTPATKFAQWQKKRKKKAAVRHPSKQPPQRAAR